MSTQAVQQGRHRRVTGPARPDLGMMLVSQDHVGHAHLWPGTGSAATELLLMPLYQPDDLTITLRYRNPSRLSNIVLGNSLGGRTELLNYERS